MLSRLDFKYHIKHYGHPKRVLTLNKAQLVIRIKMFYGYHDLLERTETGRNGPRRAGTDRNGLSWLPKRTFCVPKQTLVDTETDRDGLERTETDFRGYRNGLSGYRNGLSGYRNGL